MFDDQGGGGFYNGDQTVGGSPQKKGTERRAQNIMPVAIKQLFSLTEEMTINSVSVYLVTVVGVVKKIEGTSIKISYTIEDDTGSIAGVHWTESKGEAPKNVVENTYCRLTGTVRNVGSDVYIMAFNIRPLEDLNELISHRLEVMLVSIKSESLPPKAEPMDVGPSMNLTNSLMAVNTSINDNTLDNTQKMVLKAIQACTKESGIHINEIHSQLGPKLSRGDILKMVEFLCQEGHIYTTIDEEHYRTTDA